MALNIAALLKCSYFIGLFTLFLGLWLGCAGKQLQLKRSIPYVTSYERYLYINPFVNFSQTDIHIPLHAYLQRYFAKQGNIVKSTHLFKEAQLYLIVYLKDYYTKAYRDSIYEFTEKDALVLELEIDLKKTKKTKNKYYSKRVALRIEIPKLNPIDMASYKSDDFMVKNGNELGLSIQQARLANRLAQNIENFFRTGRFLDEKFFP